ncbi:hypothetical protein P0W48_15935 [Plesiomonas shigelloides]|uniref:hypothetical protein n=1 Tax=Plesiomonas shigelloides TaxID=703 RepID=UPI001057DA2A|nr:hypothetical protein [Plesiomonas shigelloides]
MKHVNVREIWAVGTGIKNRGQKFVAVLDSNGKYVLNRKKPSLGGRSETNKAENKIYVDSLDEAADLLSTDDYLINLVSISSPHTRALRCYNKVTIMEGRSKL